MYLVSLCSFMQIGKHFLEPWILQARFPLATVVTRLNKAVLTITSLQESCHCRWPVPCLQGLVPEAWDVRLWLTHLGSRKFR
jgi:hypothetical protein